MSEYSFITRRIAGAAAGAAAATTAACTSAARHVGATACTGAACVTASTTRPWFCSAVKSGPEVRRGAGAADTSRASMLSKAGFSNKAAP